jgi:DNA adenine methylase
VLRCIDFEQCLEQAREGDVVYCDPTYRGTKRDTFDRYGAIIFGWDDQERLKHAAQAAMKRGAVVLISNSATDELTELYGSNLELELRRSKTIGNKALNKNSYRELVAVFDPWKRRDFWFASVLGKAERFDKTSLRMKLRSPIVNDRQFVVG